MSNAARQRRRKARARNGLRVYRLELPENELVSVLIESERLSESEALDHKKVEAGTVDAVLEWIRRWNEEKSRFG